ncbi:hypothetical protein [Sphaerisporangium corydalis]|uniref:Uncharacterized protein n=1 Tax=Sphaerisporangium corydalis TaxID=1441875 RepID=A0ABV9EJH8_9ACTN|nr:hypothetical protein [Sphaerisporangium corydalis]
MLKNLSDRVLSIFVPEVEAAAGSFLQACGCKWHWNWTYWYRNCYWITVGTLYKCDPCYDSYLACSP